MEVVAATFRRTSESRQVHSLPGARPPTRPGPCPMHQSALTEPWCSVSADNDERCLTAWMRQALPLS